MGGFTRIACVGEVMIECALGEGDTAHIGVAGDTFNTAVYLKRALPQNTVAYVTALGDDAMSGRIRAALEEEALDTGLIEERAGMMPGLYAISVDEAGERSFSYWRSASAARTLFSEPAEVTPDALGAFDLVYLSAISLAVLPPQVREAFWGWAQGFRARGGRIAFDSNYRPRLWEEGTTAQEAVMRAWGTCDVALPSLDDEMALFGDASEAAVLSRLAGAGVTYGALKRGGQGPLGLGGERLEIDAPAAAQVVDSTAAGDSFNAGFLAAYVQDAPLRRCLEVGHALALQVIGHRGAIMPRS